MAPPFTQFALQPPRMFSHTADAPVAAAPSDSAACEHRLPRSRLPEGNRRKMAPSSTHFPADLPDEHRQLSGSKLPAWFAIAPQCWSSPTSHQTFICSQRTALHYRRTLLDMDQRLAILFVPQRDVRMMFA